MHYQVQTAAGEQAQRVSVYLLASCDYGIRTEIILCNGTKGVNQRQLLELRNKWKLCDLCGPHSLIAPIF